MAGDSGGADTWTGTGGSVRVPQRRASDRMSLSDDEGHGSLIHADDNGFSSILFCFVGFFSILFFST